MLVTGGSGFLGVYGIAALVGAGFRVRATVRSLGREAEVRAMLAQAGCTPGEALSFAETDLMKDEGWAAAVAGCRYVQHVASPFPVAAPKDENELIAPAREGTLRVLRAARDAGVQRVVLTSSFAAVGEGHAVRAEPFEEATWTNLAGKDVTSYAKSKTLAERAAWEFLAREGGALELTAVNPVTVFGPVLGPDYSTTILLIERLMDGSVPACPRMSFATVDVRDVADLYVRAMLRPEAKGERFLAVSGASVAMVEIAGMLRRRMGDAARRVPTREMPNWMVHVLSVFNPELKAILPQLGKAQTVSGEKARELLGWTPRGQEETIVATAESLVRLGLVS